MMLGRLHSAVRETQWIVTMGDVAVDGRASRQRAAGAESSSIPQLTVQIRARALKPQKREMAATRRSNDDRALYGDLVRGPQRVAGG